MILLWIHLIVGVLVIWPVASHIAGEAVFGVTEPSWEDWFVGGLVGIVLGVAWPLALPFAASWLLWTWVLRSSDREKVSVR